MAALACDYTRGEAALIRTMALPSDERGVKKRGTRLLLRCRGQLLYATDVAGRIGIAICPAILRRSQVFRET